MSGNDHSNKDLTMGRNNHAQDPTRLIANEDGHRWGDELGANSHGGPVLCHTSRTDLTDQRVQPHLAPTERRSRHPLTRADTCRTLRLASKVQRTQTMQGA
jgi:hypothetical protein